MYLENPIICFNFAPLINMTKCRMINQNYRSPGSCCWAAFLEAGELLENPPTCCILALHW